MSVSRTLGVAACAALVLTLACSDDPGSVQTPSGGTAGHSGSASGGAAAGTLGSAGSLANAGRAGSSAAGGTFGGGGTTSGGSVSFGGTFVFGGNASGGTNQGGGNPVGGSLSAGGDPGTGGSSNGGGCPLSAPMSGASCGAAVECEFTTSYCECLIDDGASTGEWQCEAAENPGSGGTNPEP